VNSDSPPITIVCRTVLRVSGVYLVSWGRSYRAQSPAEDHSPQGPKLPGWWLSVGHCWEPGHKTKWGRRVVSTEREQSPSADTKQIVHPHPPPAVIPHDTTNTQVPAEQWLLSTCHTRHAKGFARPRSPHLYSSSELGTTQLSV
jgi:hypothetical protein